MLEIYPWHFLCHYSLQQQRLNLEWAKIDETLAIRLKAAGVHNVTLLKTEPRDLGWQDQGHRQCSSATSA